MKMEPIETAPENEIILGAVETGEGMTGIDGPYDYKMAQGNVWLIRHDFGDWRVAEPQPTHWFPR